MGRSWRTRAFDQVAKTHAAVYRVTRGHVGGTVKGAPVLLLDHLGRKSGRWRTTPLLYLADGERFVIVASMGGSHHHPTWFINLREMEETTVQVGGETIAVSVKVGTAADKKRVWPKLVQMYPDYGAYQRRTEREIPIVLLDPIDD